MGRGQGNHIPHTAVSRSGGAGSGPYVDGMVSHAVRESLLNYPTLFQSRTRALDQILCHYGTGWEWHNGEMVCIFPPRPEDERTSPDPEVQFQQMLAKDRFVGREPSDIGLESLRKVAEDEAAKAKYVYDNIDELANNWAPLERMGPMAEEYSPLANIPDDATDEWLDACAEMARRVLECERSTYLYEHDLDSDEERAERRAAEKAKYGPEALAAIRRITREIAAEQGREPAPERSDEEIDAELERERLQRIKADANTIGKNHAIAQRALERISEIRRQRD